MNLGSLKVNNYGKLISIRGTIMRVGQSQLLCTWLTFKCDICHTQQTIRQPDGIMTIPSRCKDGCRNQSKFTPMLISPFTRTEAYQTIRLQESMVGVGLHNETAGRVPRCIDVDLFCDLVDSVSPGDDITVVGIIKVRPQDENCRKNTTNLYKMHLNCVTITSNRNALTNRKLELTAQDYEAFQMIKSEPNTFKLLVNSLCPSIYGHEMIKAGLLLGLFGGDGSIGFESEIEEIMAKTRSPQRTEVHVLIVGDPGVGKSQMLQSCSNVSPRGVFVCGNATTNAGLTVTVRHEKEFGGCIEAGALVLADRGICCIDEFDKMSANHESLLEVMEQQSVSVAKAGVLCTLPARTCILAAANPTGGHYDKSKRISENLKIGSPLLSRFDLVFILLDRPDEVLDSLMTAHIQEMHTKKTVSRLDDNELEPEEEDVDYANCSWRGRKKMMNVHNDDGAPLMERLKLKKDENLDLLPHILMQKYIAHARKVIHPTLTAEATNMLKDYYLKLRAERSVIDTIPVTVRQLEALVRLTKSRARMDLCTEASVKHAKEVLEIARFTMSDVLSVDNSNIPSMSFVSESGKSQKSKIKRFIQILSIKSNILKKTIFSVEEMKQYAASEGVAVNFNVMIETLNQQGILLKKGMTLYKFIPE